jgi:2-C-methyl-D-erythritol 4-phosphate cytidylyltransferase
MLKGKKIAAVILAAGEGSRMRANLPKQFIKIHGKEIFLYTLGRFIQCDFIDSIVLVVQSDWLKYARKHTLGLFPDDRISFIKGGDTRKKSNYAALKFLSRKNIDYVMVHDAVRPFIDHGLIKKTLNSAMKNQIAIVGKKATDLFSEMKRGRVVKVMDKRGSILTQTPECFEFGLIWKAHTKNRDEDKLSDATNLELMLESGKYVKFVETRANNLKITHPSDILLAKIILENILQ